MRRVSAPLDIAVGSLLAVASAAFGVVGFFTGLKDNSHAIQWFVAALTLSVLSGAVLLDEARLRAPTAAQTMNAWLGTFLLGGALALGTVGFVLGLANKAHATTWLIAGVIVAILALAATMDDLRRWHARRTQAIDTFAGLSIAFGLLGLGLGVVGFILGLASKQYTDTWLWAGVISSAVAFGWSFEAEHRAVLAGEAGQASELPRINRGGVAPS